MSATALRARLAEIEAQRTDLSVARDRLIVAIEEAEGRPESLDARLARAALADDWRTFRELRVEQTANYFRDYGHLPDAEVDAAALTLATEQKGAA